MFSGLEKNNGSCWWSKILNQNAIIRGVTKTWEHNMTQGSTFCLTVTLITLLISDANVNCFEAPTNSCAVAIHNYLSNTIPVFDTNKKSLSIDLGKVHLFIQMNKCDQSLHSNPYGYCGPFFHFHFDLQYRQYTVTNISHTVLRGEFRKKDDLRHHSN